MRDLGIQRSDGLTILRAGNCGYAGGNGRQSRWLPAFPGRLEAIPVPSGAHRPEQREARPRMVITTPLYAWLLHVLGVVSAGRQEVNQPGVSAKEGGANGGPGSAGRLQEKGGGVSCLRSMPAAVSLVKGCGSLA